MYNDDVINSTVGMWHSVEERLPIEEAKKFEEENHEMPMFIVMIDKAELPTTLWFDYNECEWYEVAYDGTLFPYDVTHWMMLPEPPNR